MKIVRADRVYSMATMSPIQSSKLGLPSQIRAGVPHVVDVTATYRIVLDHLKLSMEFSGYYSSATVENLLLDQTTVQFCLVRLNHSSKFDLLTHYHCGSCITLYWIGSFIRFWKWYRTMFLINRQRALHVHI